MKQHLIENKKTILLILLAVAVAVGIGFEIYSSYYRSTEDAYISADVIPVAAQVSGRVTRVYVKDNQHVKKGDPLFDIDPDAYRIALERAQANLAQAMQNARQDTAEVAAARAQVEQTSLDLKNAQDNYDRAKRLVASHFLSQQAADDAHTRVQTLQAALQQARANLAKARSVPAKLQKRADVLRAQAEVAQAKLDLSNTHVIARQDGLISHMSLTPGVLVSPGAPQFALIAEDSFHIDANFKETELPGIHPGEKVDIEIDMYPGHVFHGTVESLSGGTGTAFSLLPPQNATGNWVKIAQRVPVRIKFDHIDPDRPLRIGATATVKVHLK